MFTVKSDFKGANIKVFGVTENTVKIDVDLRDTTEDWFYWCFKVENAGGKTITFEFPSDARVGYFGAAVSHNFKDWHWQYSDAVHNGNSFTYIFESDENEVYFAHDILYRPEYFIDFADKNSLAIKTLCQSEKGEAVPYLDIGSSNDIILLTVRHHACESTGSYILEGVLSGFLSDSFFEKYRIICVPFVDYDGVINGDQGKSRKPYDHNRDYDRNKTPIYNTVKEIRRIADNGNVKFAFDFHSPWHLGEQNDTVFIPIKNKKVVDNISKFSKFFEAENNSNSFCFYTKDNMMPDVAWNKSDLPTCSNYIDAELSFSLETPYFKAYDIQFSPEKAYNTGVNFVKALKKYIEK